MKHVIYVDEKVTMWRRFRYEVTASSQAEAIDQFTARLKEPIPSEEGITEVTDLIDSIEQITPAENGGQATIEARYESKEIAPFYTNEPKEDE